MTYAGDEWYGEEITSPLPHQPMLPSKRDDWEPTAEPERSPDPFEEEEEEGEPAEPDQPQPRPEDDPNYEGPPSGIWN